MLALFQIIKKPFGNIFLKGFLFFNPLPIFFFDLLQRSIMLVEKSNFQIVALRLERNGFEFSIFLPTYPTSGGFISI